MVGIAGIILMVGIVGIILMVGIAGEGLTLGMTHSILLGDIRVLVVGAILIQALVMADLTHLIAFTRPILIMEIVGTAMLGTMALLIISKLWTPVVVQVQITTIE